MACMARNRTHPKWTTAPMRDGSVHTQRTFARTPKRSEDSVSAALNREGLQQMISTVRACGRRGEMGACAADLFPLVRCVKGACGLHHVVQVGSPGIGQGMQHAHGQLTVPPSESCSTRVSLESRYGLQQ